MNKRRKLRLKEHKLTYIATSSKKIKSKNLPPRFGVFGAFPELLSGAAPLEVCWEEGVVLYLCKAQCWRAA
jgi:hypothetical protein